MSAFPGFKGYLNVTFNPWANASLLECKALFILYAIFVFLPQDGDKPPSFARDDAASCWRQARVSFNAAEA